MNRLQRMDYVDHDSPEAPGRILIVDDEPEIRDVFREYLEGAGYIVDTAADATQAVEYFYSNTYDLVTLDYRMQQTTGANIHLLFSKGFGYGRRVSELLPQKLPPILIITGCANEPGIQKLLDAEHVVGLLHKPLRGDSLVQTIASIIQRQNETKSRRQNVSARLRPHLKPEQKAP
jgi:two-component system NtrC family sensor kinase